jgi:methionyl-tRNA synthetase
MEGRKFSSSRSVVIYVRDFLDRYDADALRYFIAVAGPENQDTDFTWAEFVRRTNDELVAGWGNLVNRTVSMAAKNIGHVPEAGRLTGADTDLLGSVRAAFPVVGGLLEKSRQKAAISEAMRVVSEVNKYISDMAPWKLRSEDPDRMATVLHVALQAVRDCNTLLTPFLPHSAQQVHELLGGEGVWSGLPEVREVQEDGNADYPVITGDYAAAAARWEPTPIVPGVPLSAPTPIFRKLDPAVVDEELARLEEKAGL